MRMSTSPNEVWCTSRNDSLVPPRKKLRSLKWDAIFRCGEVMHKICFVLHQQRGDDNPAMASQFICISLMLLVTGFLLFCGIVAVMMLAFWKFACASLESHSLMLQCFHHILYRNDSLVPPRQKLRSLKWNEIFRCGEVMHKICLVLHQQRGDDNPAMARHCRECGEEECQSQRERRE